MSDKRIEFEHRVDGVLTAVTSVVLADDANVFGVQRIDNDEVIVAAGTPLVAEATTGVYGIDLTGLVAGKSYRYAVRWIFDGNTDSQLQTFTAVEGTAEGLYADVTDAEDIIGADNLTAISQLEGSTDRDYAKIQRGFNWADSEVHRRFRMMGVWAVPLAGLDADSTKQLADISAELAIWWIDQSRGSRNIGSNEKPKVVSGIYDNLRLDALARLDDIALNPRTFKATKLSNAPATRIITVGVVPCATRVLLPASYPLPPITS